MINLGDRVKDTVTGFTGIAVCRAQWLHGCTRIVVQPEGIGKDGKTFENSSFDEPQIEIIKRNAVKVPEPVVAKPKTGGPMPVPHARQHINR